MSDRSSFIHFNRQAGIDRNVYVFSVNGGVLNTGKGQFIGLSLIDTSYPLRPTRDLTAITDSGMIVISMRPGNKAIAERIGAIRATMNTKRLLTPAMDAQYKEAQEASANGRGYALGFRGLLSLRQGKQIPPGGVLTLALPPLLLRPPYEHVLFFSADDEKTIDALIPPSHSGYGTNPILIGYSPEGMAQYVSLGGEQNAAHVVFLGRTRSGKSTIVKEVIRQIMETYGNKIRVVVADLKGEYVRSNKSPDGSVFYETIVPASIIGKRDFLPIGWRVLQCTSYDDAHTEALYESRMANYVLEILGIPHQPEIPNILINAWRHFMQNGGTPEVRQKVLAAIYRKISANLPPESTAATLFGGNGRITQTDHSVLYLGWSAYGSPDQRAAFLWGISGLVPLIGSSAYLRTVMVIEEFQLLPQDLLDTILRVCGGKGVSAIFVTQAYKQLEQLGGAGKQFSAAVIMAPQIGEVQSVARTVFEMDISEVLSDVTRRQILEMTKPFGWGAIISPAYGINVAIAELSNEFLSRIESFNIGRRDGWVPEDKSEI